MQRLRRQLGESHHRRELPEAAKETERLLMSFYSVSWTLDAIEAETPAEAAQIALEIMQDPNSEARFFDITDQDTGKVVHSFEAVSD